MKILMVDDSKFSQISGANLLKKVNPDAEIIFANNGEEGLAKFKENRPDFVLIDLLMPVVTGKELVQHIKAVDQEAKLFDLSADVQKSVQEEVLSYGVLAFINKPLSEEKARQIFAIAEGGGNEQR